MAGVEALLVVVVIEGDERSTRQQLFLKVLLADRGGGGAADHRRLFCGSLLRARVVLWRLGRASQARKRSGEAVCAC